MWSVRGVRGCSWLQAVCCWTISQAYQCRPGLISLKSKSGSFSHHIVISGKLTDMHPGLLLPRRKCGVGGGGSENPLQGKCYSRWLYWHLTPIQHQYRGVKATFYWWPGTKFPVGSWLLSKPRRRPTALYRAPRVIYVKHPNKCWCCVTPPLTAEHRLAIWKSYPGALLCFLHSKTKKQNKQKRRRKEVFAPVVLHNLHVKRARDKHWWHILYGLW